MANAWGDFAGEIQAAVLTAVAADNLLKSGGTYSVVTREALPAVAGGSPKLHKGLVPYIGVACSLGSPRFEGSSMAIPVIVNIHTAEKENPAASARVMAVKMAMAAVKIVMDMDGTSPGASGHQTTFSSSHVEEPKVDDSDSTLVRVDATAELDVWYHD